MKLRLIVIALLMIAMSACNIASLHPLFTKESLIFRSDILGNWENKEDDINDWIFKSNEDENLPGYDVVFTTNDFTNSKLDTFSYKVHLVKLGDYYFFDFERKLTENEEAKYTAFISPLISSHSFARVEFKNRQVIIRFFDYDFLKTLFEQQKIRLKHERLSNDNIVLTAPTEELQKFVLKYADEPKAYQEALVLKRKES